MKVLLVENDELVREALSDVLRGLDCKVVQATGECAYEIFTAEKDVPFDLVITANKFQEESGLEFIECVRLKDKEIPILLISANSNVTLEIALYVGADAFLPKPFPIEDLELIILQILIKKHSKKVFKNPA